MQEYLLVLYVLVAVALIGLILIQHGKGADMGASFGSGSSNTVFGSSGSGNFMTRLTGILATLFMILSLLLGFMASRDANDINDPYQIKVDAKLPVVNNAAPVVTAVPVVDAAKAVPAEPAKPEVAKPELNVEPTVPAVAPAESQPAPAH